MYYSSTCPSPLGTLTLASDGTHLVGLWIEGQKYFGASLPTSPKPRDDLPLFAAVRDWLARYFAGKAPSPAELPLRPAGSAFRQVVWRILCGIPYGRVMTYGEIAVEAAAQLGRVRMSGQAVGGAVGHNPISIIIPCHRVVGANGSLTGYAGGVDKKLRLLELEGVDTSTLFTPRKGTAL